MPAPAMQQPPLLLPDAGPLITLAYAGKLELLLQPGWPLRVVDMVLHELTRKDTPTRDAIQSFMSRHQPPLIDTETFAHHRRLQASASPAPRKAGLGELALQEAITRLALAEPPQRAVLLFEDHKIARDGFHLPQGTMRVSTRAFLVFLEEKGWLESAADVEREAVLAGRRFSALRFP
jgi:hypothetical protein